MHETLLTVVVLFQLLQFWAAWFKYRHQKGVEERLMRMERVLDIANSVMFNQRKFLPMIGAMAGIYEKIVGVDEIHQKMKSALEEE